MQGGIMSRTEEIKQAVSDFLGVYDRWGDPRNNRPEHPDHEFWSGYQDLVNSVMGGDHPKKCRRIIAAVIRLNSEGDEYDNTDELTLSETFKRTVDELRSALRYAGIQRHRPPSVTELMKLPNMTKLNVCTIWGLFRPDGTPDIDAVDRELANPGSSIAEDYWPSYLKKHVNDDEGERLYRDAIKERGPLYAATVELEDAHFGVPGETEQGEETDGGTDRDGDDSEKILAAFEGMTYKEMVEMAKDMGVNPHEKTPGRPSKKAIALLIHEAQERAALAEPPPEGEWMEPEKANS
jgi:hypothetical protein